MDTPNAVDLWSRTCKRLQETLHPDVYARWIAVIEPVTFDGTNLTLAVDNDYYQSWLEEHYLPMIKDSIALEFAVPVSIAFQVSPRQVYPVEPVVEPKRRKPGREAAAKGTKPEARLNQKFTFNSFIIGPSNNFAHAASMAVAQAPARAYNPLFIYGDVGLGKTHLMQAIGHHVVESSHASICYVACEAMMNEYIDSLQNRTVVQFRKKYRSTDLLLIDDIHFLAGKERLQEEFFHTFNALFDAHRQIVMTSDRPASELSGLDRRLVSRFEWGLVTELSLPDFETRLAILRHKQAAAQVALPDELLEFIAKNVRSNIRKLEGALIRAISFASLTGNKLTLESLESLLKDSIDREKHTEVSIDSIQRAVAEQYDIRLADMTSKRRPQSVAFPRQVAMFLSRRFTEYSLPEIANAFGKTHATVMHACKTIEGRMGSDPVLKQRVQNIASKLGKNLA